MTSISCSEVLRVQAELSGHLSLCTWSQRIFVVKNNIRWYIVNGSPLRGLPSAGDVFPSFCLSNDPSILASFFIHERIPLVFLKGGASRSQGLSLGALRAGHGLLAASASAEIIFWAGRKALVHPKAGTFPRHFHFRKHKRFEEELSKITNVKKLSLQKLSRNCGPNKTVVEQQVKPIRTLDSIESEALQATRNYPQVQIGES